MSDSLSFAFEDGVTPRLVAAELALGGALQSVAEALDRALLGAVRAEASGPILQRRTGAFLASLTAETHVGADGVVASVATDSPQAAILEYGGEIPAHLIAPDQAKALRFKGGAGDVFAAAVRMPEVHIPAHPVFATALADVQGEIVEGFTEAVGLALREALS